MGDLLAQIAAILNSIALSVLRPDVRDDPDDGDDGTRRLRNFQACPICMSGTVGRRGRGSRRRSAFVGLAS